MKTAEEIRKITYNVKGVNTSGLKLLAVNADNPLYIPLPYKPKMVEIIINNAAISGNKFAKIHNEITKDTEELLIKNGFKVRYCKKYIKVSW